MLNYIRKMKTYKSIEEWKESFTKEEQKKFNDKEEVKVVINNDNEIINFTIKIK